MYKNKEVIVKLSEEAENVYLELQKVVAEEKSRGIESSLHQTLFRSILRSRDLLKENPFAGNQIQKRIIPNKYINKYDAQNLWRIELSDRWRMIYTITGGQIEIVTFILDIFSHSEYDKVFGYKH